MEVTVEQAVGFSPLGLVGTAILEFHEQLLLHRENSEWYRAIGRIVDGLACERPDQPIVSQPFLSNP